MSEITPKQIIEALLMVSEEPLSVERLHKILNTNDNVLELNMLRDIISELVDNYINSGIELKEVASGWRFQIKPELSEWVSKLYEERPPKYSRALLEILALVAYRQPITRAEVESIRGVAVSSNIIKTLLEHEWVRIVGHKEVPGKPALFATTKKFLDHFNLKHLDELPTLIEFTESIAAEAALEITEETTEEVTTTNITLFDPYEDFNSLENDSALTNDEPKETDD